MKHLKRLVSVTLVCALLLMLVAGVANAEDKKTVHLWTHYQHDYPYIEQKIKEYNETNTDNVNVDLVLIANDGYNQTVQLAFQNDEGPDLFADGINMTDFKLQGWIAPLDDLISAENKDRILAYKIPGGNTFDGQMYTTPFCGYNFRLVWNKDLFAAAGLDPETPPKSWEEVRAFAKQITAYGVKQEVPKYGFMLPVGEDWIWWQYAYQMNYASGYSLYDWNTGFYAFDQTKPLLTFYKQLNEDGSLFPGCLQMANDPARAQFSEGNVGMMLAANWDVGVFNDQFPAKIDWGVAPLPTETGEVKGKPQFDATTYMMINANSGVKQEAMKVYEYLLSPELLGGYYAEGYGLPVFPDAKANAPHEPTKHGFAGFANTEIDAVYPPEPFGYNLEGDKYDVVFVNIVAGNIADMDAAFADLNARYNTALEELYAAGDVNKADYMVTGFSPMHPMGE